MGEARPRQYRGPQMNNSDRPRPNFDRMRMPQIGQGFRSPDYNQGNNPYARMNQGMQMQQGQRYNTPSTSTQICFKCGRQAHSHINYCPAINAQCWTCGKRGQAILLECVGGGRVQILDSLNIDDVAHA